ncbi:MAG: hypothetical protein ACMUIP_18195 [bacterium]
MSMKKIFKITLLFSLLLLIGVLVYSPIAQAQNWVELPPYNTLWPLWSPALSPIDDITGLPTPIVSSLAFDTVLPVMPGLTWDPSMPYPWLLYNTIGGLAYFDPLAGINPWPAPSLLDDAGLPAPLALPPEFALLPPTDITWLANNIPIANFTFLFSFPPQVTMPPPTAVAPPLSALLTPIDIIGAGAALPPAFAPILPPPPAPIPTVILPPTLPVPTLPVPTVPLPTAPIPTVPVPTLPVPTVPVLAAPVPTLPVPTLVVPTAPIPTVPVPIVPPPTIPVPTAPIPTVPVPTIPVTAIIPIPPPTIVTAVVPPTAAVSALGWFF